ncbi:uncharacterized protein GVI51_E06017 [Nakaseomyces glabratus]|uniref:37S ribosomal protein S22, mitochondrial n=1 Tax=Candida glabrata (strain ATCC 2001 / BCRC 20586 / JCM 3761 / NBRC 0622 / NRRL Y-65 / CBS 138) TaxID=284593 RepID=Q6FUY0_CANGA|nr:mitochondrial 37S ribosomal protein RSM22 [Nakaseomyces glabratus]KAH7606332.1 Mitochondrial small ribosomal subunit Rsm22 [Nakaseomyces glabratus]KAH7607730.1 Mitochondrial small ribosomal subunit Rsm22 [Nakaseomyces glabratus]QHS65601.1 uncharacterized protein GVI51_E06017 [Nakaseomyces glabratus]CAG58883.1 unnamed protein product [Nakaseomyces glabratus]|eukprot:XP_445964.1 mitochondrial 37S ribosomal protein RSM22 [[Candida] glabrata]
MSLRLFNLKICTSNLQTLHKQWRRYSVISKETIKNFDIDRPRSDDHLNYNINIGSNAQEKRLLPETLEGRSHRNIIELNSEVAKCINNNILSLHIPNNIRRVAKNYFEELQTKNSIHRSTKSPMEVDAHIASIFLQNYTAIFQTLMELKKRKKSFRPKRVLDIGFGPATGILAFNDVMGPDYKCETKDSVIYGHIEMQKRAKLLLSRQYNEIPDNDEAVSECREQNVDDIPEEDSLVGAVMTKKININTNLRTNLPTASEYDLIIMTHQLLKTKEKFNTEVEENLSNVLNLLAPNGQLIIIERGNPIGYETIARARQIMLRPENYPDEKGKIPRPWEKGYIRNRFRENSNSIPHEDYASAKTDYYLYEIAPYPHHGKDILQTGKPIYYELKEGKNLKFINFQKTVRRPKFSIEHKRGQLLSAPWDRKGDRFVDLSGSGRRNGNDYEIVNFCYIIMERTSTDKSTLEKIKRARENSKNNHTAADFNLECSSVTWPRIITEPVKRKGHVTLDVVTATGLIEKWTIPKSFSKEIYHDARKAIKGDLWPHSAKTKILGMAPMKLNKLKEAEKRAILESRKEFKRKEREVALSLNEINNATNEDHLSKINDSDLEGVDRMRELANAYGYYFDRRKM